MIFNGKGPLFKAAVCVSLAGLTSGCFPNPETAAIVAAPKTPANKTFTSFSASLRCMDDLMNSYNKHDITITTVGILDQTQKVSVGTKEMLINALNQMSRKSKAFTFIDYDPLNSMIFQDAQRASGQVGFKVPAYYIRGAITQLDDNALESQAGASISTPFADLGVSKDQIASLVSVDMNVGETVSRQIIPDAGSSNTMAVVRTGRSGEAGGKIGKAGLSLNISLNQSEGLGAAVRALIELGAIETMGQFTQTPYWKCLQIEKSNPKMLEQARDWFDSMPPDEQVRFIQRKLAAINYYRGPVTGTVDSATREAISRYQAETKLIANGRPSFEVYYALLDDDQPLNEDPNRPQPTPLVATRQTAPVQVQVVSDRGNSPTYTAGSILNASAEVDRETFLYCYYQDSDRTVARLFPNRYQPDAYVRARSIPISSERQTVKVRFDKPGVERISCLASNQDVRLPPVLQQKDLTPLRVGSLEEVETLFRGANPAVSAAHLEITVK